MKTHELHQRVFEERGVKQTWLAGKLGKSFNERKISNMLTLIQLEQV